MFHVHGSARSSDRAEVFRVSYFLFPPLFGAWVSADAATDLTAFGVFELLKSLEAFEATDCEVRSLLAILISDLGLYTPLYASATST